MEFTLIVGILLFIIVVYLIFKFVKKVIFAIISVFILILLIIAGVGGLAYLDFKSLSSQENFVVNVVYAQEESLLYGVQIPFENSQANVDQVSGISNIKTLDVEKVSTDSAEFVVVIDEVLFRELIAGKTFSFEELLPEEEFGEYNITLTDVEILRVLDSSNPDDELIELIFEKANIPTFMLESFKPTAKSMLNSALEDMDMTVKEALFSLVLSELAQDQEAIIPLLEGFKGDGLEVYPQRITFDLLKYIPTSVIEEQIPTVE